MALEINHQTATQSCNFGYTDQLNDYLEFRMAEPTFNLHTENLIFTTESSIQVFVQGLGPLLVILPSLGRGVEDMFEFSNLLANTGFRSCLINPRGIGESKGDLENLTLNQLADDVASVIENLTAGPAFVAGHAFGNWVARNLATRRPDLVSRVALLAAAHKEFPIELREQIDICMNSELDAESRIRALKLAFFSEGNDPSTWLEGWYPKVAVAQRHAAAACPRSEWWHAGTAPILDLQGDADPFAPFATATDLQNELGLDRVTVIRIPQTSHALIPENPAAVSRALAEFFIQ